MSTITVCITGAGQSLKRWYGGISHLPYNMIKEGPSYTGPLWKVVRRSPDLLNRVCRPLIIYYLDCKRLYYSIPNDLGPQFNWRDWKIYRVRFMTHLTGIGSIHYLMSLVGGSWVCAMLVPP